MINVVPRALTKSSDADRFVANLRERPLQHPQPVWRRKRPPTSHVGMAVNLVTVCFIRQFRQAYSCQGI